MKKTLGILLNFVIFPCIGILLLYLAFKNVDLQKLWNDIKTANFYWVGLSLCFGFLAFVSRAMRWKLLIEPLGYKPSTRNTIFAVINAYFANVAMPRLGEITRCGSLNKTDNIPMDKLFGTVITERLIDFVTLLMIISFVLIMKFEQVGGFFYNQILNPLYQKYFTSGLFWVVAVSSALLLGVVFLLFRKKIMKNAIFQKINKFLTGLFSGLKSVLRMKQRGLFLFHTLFIWTMYVLMTYVVFFAIEPTKNLTFLDSLFILSIGSLGMAAPVQNGFGAYHWIVSLGLMLYPGITQADGLLYATICHESQLLMIIVIGPLALGRHIFYQEEKIKTILILLWKNWKS